MSMQAGEESELFRFYLLGSRFVVALVLNEGKLGIFVTLPFPANMFCTDDPESAFLAVGTITFMLVVCDTCTSFHVVSRRIQGPHLL